MPLNCCSACSAYLPSQAFLGSGPLLVLFNKRSTSIQFGMPLVIVGLRGIQQNQQDRLLTVLIQCSKIKELILKKQFLQGKKKSTVAVQTDSCLFLLFLKLLHLKGKYLRTLLRTLSIIKVQFTEMSIYMCVCIYLYVYIY